MLCGFDVVVPGTGWPPYAAPAGGADNGDGGTTVVRIFVVLANHVGSGTGSRHSGTAATVVDVFVDFLLGVKAGFWPSREHTVSVVDDGDNTVRFDWFFDSVDGSVGAGG